ncbi:hypothetical protein D6D06_05001 [Aureobasidium pullulans]|nr:hypothetical protein D6D06_05001 [Aureobasidium pullulans]
MPSLTNVLLHSIAYMAEKFPDKWMEKIPYYRAREEEMEKEERDARRARKHSHKRSSSHKSSRSHRSHRRDDYYADEEASDEYDEEEYDRRDRRRHRSLDGRRREEEARINRRSYNPADYAPVDKYGYAVHPTATPYPIGNGAVPGAIPVTTSITNGHRPTSSSGPIPGYVPYAHVYSTPAQSTKPDYPYASDARDSPRGSSDRYERRDYHADPRGRRYNDSHDYADDADVKYRRRDSRYD